MRIEKILSVFLFLLMMVLSVLARISYETASSECGGFGGEGYKTNITAMDAVKRTFGN